MGFLGLMGNLSFLIALLCSSAQCFALCICEVCQFLLSCFL